MSDYFNSAAARRQYTERTTTSYLLAGTEPVRRKYTKRASAVVQAVKVEHTAPKDPHPLERPTGPLPPHRDYSALVNWSDPEDIAYIHRRTNGESQVPTALRNAQLRQQERERHYAEQHARYLKHCEQDEARIHQLGTTTAGYFDPCEASRWLGSNILSN